MADESEINQLTTSSEIEPEIERERLLSGISNSFKGMSKFDFLDPQVSGIFEELSEFFKRDGV